MKSVNPDSDRQVLRQEGSSQDSAEETPRADAPKNEEVSLDELWRGAISGGNDIY